MKRDSLHSGRRPSGLCGAALLLAARLHEFRREPSDVVRIVKVHESTLRKRLIEFGDTPSGALTLDEFLTVDLEEEQDPPAFIAARKKDRERLKKLADKDGDIVITQLQKEIESQLDSDLKRKHRNISAAMNITNEEEIEKRETDQFVLQTTLSELDESFIDDPEAIDSQSNLTGLGPDFESMGLLLDPSIPPTGSSISQFSTNTPLPASTENVEEPLDIEDDDEINSIILTTLEVKHKSNLWHKMNASYLADQKAKAEKLAKEKEEGKPEKKKRRNGPRKKYMGAPASSAGEAIEKMLQEKKISSKINYDILMSLNKGGDKDEANTSEIKEPTAAPVIVPESPSRKKKIPVHSMKPTIINSPVIMAQSNKKSKTKMMSNPGLPVVLSPHPSPLIKEVATPKQSINTEDYADYEDYDEDCDVQEKTAPEMESLSQLLRSQDDDNEDYVFDEY